MTNEQKLAAAEEMYVFACTLHEREKVANANRRMRSLKSDKAIANAQTELKYAVDDLEREGSRARARVASVMRGTHTVESVHIGTFLAR